MKLSILMKIRCSLSWSQKPTTGPQPEINTTRKLFIIAIRIYCLPQINTEGEYAIKQVWSISCWWSCQNMYDVAGCLHNLAAQQGRPLIASCTRYMIEDIPELLKYNEIPVHNKKGIAASDVSSTGLISVSITFWQSTASKSAHNGCTGSQPNETA
jgi:hypothetical protein